MKLRSLIKGRRYRLLARLMVNGLCQAIMTVALALLIKLAFDRFIATSDSSPVNEVILFSCGLAMIAVFTSWLRMRERIDAEQLGQS